MHFTRILRGSVSSVIFASLFFLADCSSGLNFSSPALAPQEAPAPQSARQLRNFKRAAGLSPGFADADAASTGAVIVAGLGGGNVYVYTEIGKLVAEITGIDLPVGLALDGDGNVYISNEGNNSPGVLVYKNDYKTLVATLSSPPSYSVAVDLKTGLVAVANIIGHSANVSFYAKGATTPCANVSDKGLAGFAQVAFDKAGSLYATGGAQDGTPVVAVIRGGCSAKSVTLLSTENTLIDFIFGIQVTPNGKIAVEDNTTIYTYNAPIKNALGTPIATTQLEGALTPQQFAFTKSGKYIFVADQTLGKTFKYAYPGGANALKYIAPQNEPIGVVLTPAAQQ